MKIAAKLASISNHLHKCIFLKAIATDPVGARCDWLYWRPRHRLALVVTRRY
ncbi:hypothetical protein D3C80_2187900 [compost metagenome]